MYGAAERSTVGEIARCHLHGLPGDVPQPVKLGQGGSGVVWKARWTPTDDECRRCGLSPLPPSSDRTACSLDVAVKTMAMTRVALKWERELDVLRSLPRHPYVVRVFGYSRFVFEGLERLALVMELAQHSLDSEVPNGADGSGVQTDGRIREPQRLKAEQQREMTLLSLIQLASALSFCHSHDILHRDVKPMNFLRLRRGNSSVAVLTDFGESRLVPSASKGSGLTKDVGTTGYMAPEVADQLLKGIAVAVYSAAADVYSFGLSMLEMLPRKQVLKHFPEEVTARLDQVIVRCTSQQRGQRPTMNAVVNELERCLHIVRICRLSPAEIISESYWELLHSGRQSTPLDDPLNSMLNMVNTIDNELEASVTPSQSSTVDVSQVRLRGSSAAVNESEQSVNRLKQAVQDVKEAAMPPVSLPTHCHYDQLVARYLGELFIRCAQKERFAAIIAKAIGQPYSPDINGVVGFIREQLSQLDDLAREHEEARVVKQKLLWTIELETDWTDIRSRLTQRQKESGGRQKGASSTSSSASSSSSIPSADRSVLVHLHAVDVDSVKGVIQREVHRLHATVQAAVKRGAVRAGDADKVVDSFSRIFAPLYMIFIRVGRFNLSLPPSLALRVTRDMARFSFAPYHLISAALVDGKSGKTHKLWEKAALVLMGVAIAPVALIAMIPTAVGQVVRHIKDSAWKSIYERANHSLLQAAICVLTSVDGIEADVQRKIEKFHALEADARDHSAMQWYLIRTLAEWATNAKVQALTHARSPQQWYDCFRSNNAEQQAPAFIFSQLEFKDDGGAKVPFKDQWRWIRMINTVVALYALRRLQVAHGAKLVVCGPQQSGKTTLVQLLRGEKPPKKAVNTRFPTAIVATIGPSSYQLMDLPGFDDLTALGPTILAHSLQHVKGVVFVCSLDNCNNEKLPSFFRILAAAIPSHCRILFCINKVEQQLINLGDVRRPRPGRPVRWPRRHNTSAEDTLYDLVAPRIRDVLRVRRRVFPQSLMEIQVVQVNRTAGWDGECLHLLRRKYPKLREKVWSFNRIKRWVEDNCPAWRVGDQLDPLDLPAGEAGLSPRAAYHSEDEDEDDEDDEDEDEDDEDDEKEEQKGERGVEDREQPAASDQAKDEDEGVYVREEWSQAAGSRSEASQSDGDDLDAAES